MTDNSSNNTKKTLSLSLGKKLEVGTVKQSISRSKSKSVTVEVKKSRSFKLDKNEGFLTNDDSNLTEHERKARLEAIKFAEESRKASQEQQFVGKVGIEIAIPKKDDEEILTAPVKKKEEVRKAPPAPNPTPLSGKKLHTLEAGEIRNLDALTPKQKEEKAKQQQDKQVFIGNPFETNALGLPKKKSSAKVTKEDLDNEIEERKKTSAGKPKFGDSDFDDKKLKKLTISQALDFDGEERVRSIAAYKRKRQNRR